MLCVDSRGEQNGQLHVGCATTCMVNLFTCHTEEFMNPVPYLGYQCENKIEELRSKGLLSICEEQNL